MASFSAIVGDWAQRVPRALEAVFKESAQELVEQMQIQLTDMVYEQPVGPSGYLRTGFLRASLVASKTAMPMMTRDNPGVALPPDLGEIVLVINSMDENDTLYLGYTANYAGYVHYGARGRPARPWITLVAQRWDSIVATKAAEVKRRLGL